MFVKKIAIHSRLVAECPILSAATMVGIHFHSITAVAVVIIMLPLAASQSFRSSTCAGGTYDAAANSTFRGNLELLAAALPGNASATPAGFAAGTVGAVPNQVSALALCRGDTDAPTCRECVAAALPGARRDCPGSKDVTVYQDACVVRFSDQRFLDFVGVNSPYAVFSWDADSLAVPAARFDAAVVALMSATADRAVAASAAPSSSARKKYFATAVMDFDDAHYPRIYGLEQCVPDMSAAQCQSCLQGLVASIPGFLKGRPGGRSLGIWCNLRYSVRPFFNGSAMLHLAAPAPAPAPSVDTPKAGAGAGNVRPGFSRGKFPTATCSSNCQYLKVNLVLVHSSGRKRRAAVRVSAGVACSVVLFILISSAVAVIRFKRKVAAKNDLCEC
jgi:hypothetical protein